MARGRGEKNYFGFNAGLITEGSKLQYVPDSLSDIDNFVIRLNKGLRRRRGLDYESDAVVLGNTTGVGDISLPAGVAPAEVPQFRGIYKWISANGESGRDYVFLAVPNLILCYGLSSRPLSDNFLCYIRHDSEGMVSFSSHGPWLVIAREGGVLPLALNIEQDALEKGGSEYFATQLTIRARDFGEITTKIPPGQRPQFFGPNIDAASGQPMVDFPQYSVDEYRYDLLNGGWNVSGINAFLGHIGRLPSKGDVYAVGVGTNPNNGSEQFRPQAFSVSYAGPPSSITPRGRFILDVYSPNRAQATLNSGFASSVIPNPPADYVTTVGAYAGRMWYGGKSNKLYYSVQLRDESAFEQLGNCYQEQDPTAVDFNELLATDGGAIPVAGGGNWQALVPFGNSLVAMNTRGVWEISGREGMMSAENISVRKLSDAGLVGRYTPVVTDAALFYWTENGINAVTADPTVGTLVVQNVTDNTIYDLYSQITNLGKLGCRAVYDTREKKVYWFYNKDLATTVDDSSKASNVLVFDLRINGFYKFTISDADLPNFPPPPPPAPPPDPVVCRRNFQVYDPFFGRTFIQPVITNADGQTKVRMVLPGGNSGSGARISPFAISPISWSGIRLFEVMLDPIEAAGYCTFQLTGENSQESLVLGYYPSAGSVQISTARAGGAPGQTKNFYPPAGQPVGIGIDGDTGDVHVYINGVSVTPGIPFEAGLFSDPLVMTVTAVPSIVYTPQQPAPPVDVEFTMNFGVEFFEVGYPSGVFDWCGNYSAESPSPGSPIPLVPPFVLAPFIEALTYDESSEEIVYVDDEEVYVDDEVVTVPVEQRSESEARVKFFIYTPQPSGYGFTVGDLGGTRLRDWYSYNNIGVPYLSYAEAGYDTFDDPKREKEVDTIFMWFEITENGIVPTEPEPPQPEPADKQELEDTYAQHCTECEVEGACSPELTAACAAGLDVINDEGATQEEVDEANDEILQWVSPSVNATFTYASNYSSVMSGIVDNRPGGTNPIHTWRGVAPNESLSSVAYPDNGPMNRQQYEQSLAEFRDSVLSASGYEVGDSTGASVEWVSPSEFVYSDNDVVLSNAFGGFSGEYSNLDDALAAGETTLLTYPVAFVCTDSSNGDSIGDMRSSFGSWIDSEGYRCYVRLPAVVVNVEYN